MATYPAIIGAKSSAKRHKMNQIYGTTTAVTPVIKQQTKGPNMFKRMIRGLITWGMTDRHEEDICIKDPICLKE